MISTADIKNININNTQEHQLNNDNIELPNTLDIIYKIHFVKFSVLKVKYSISPFHFLISL